ncbi:hypothetical protein SRS16CHR_05353 [Variovorax sp. SRS16]|uniref:hypothetical protein n=1 Tax=Variovorax sp. SRS16 TaxID=282217 RepID=UPI0013185298|nr:hypothetical protein [Variovorax sp. SRS16]VTU33779.1 hypothetical protein SRS16CHR_05353 [Variovorax sp. SRS16]
MKSAVHSTLALVLAAGGLLFAGAASAADPAGGGTTLQRERATCDGVQQDRAACLREAGAARQEAARNGLTSPPPRVEEQNATARCSEQPASARAECEARMRGTGQTTVEGSVMGGGILRETVTPIPAKP